MYFIDKEDSLCFNLLIQDGELIPFQRTDLEFSKEKHELLLDKVKKVKSGSSDIIQVNKLEQTFYYDRSVIPASREEYNRLYEFERELADKAIILLKENNIDIEIVDVIE